MKSNLAKSCFFVGYLGPQDSNDGKNQHKFFDEFVSIKTVNIPPLNHEDIVEFLSANVSPCSQDYDNLATILLTRSKGNYAFLKEIVKFCETKGIVKFQIITLTWLWDISRLEQEVEVTTDALGLMIKLFQEMDYPSQKIVKLAGFNKLM
jgi:predicted ATPase